MSDDKDISLLISQSLRRKLTRKESEQVESHLNSNDEARKFAELSRLIQKSVAGDPNQEAIDESVQLTDDARERLKASVSGAIKEKLSLSQAGLIENTLPYDSATRKTVDGDPIDHRAVVSRFHLIRRLGQGGLGNVWLARDEKLNRTVAIKELNTDALQSPQAWQRFHREAEITGHLEHPNVVPLYQYGVDRMTGEPFYAMRFVGKRTLANAIEEFHDRSAIDEAGVLELHRLLTVFLDICQAIAYAHSRGVIHRDLKPENVALDNFGQVIVLDWGLAKVLEDSELASKMTGTPSVNESVLSQTMMGDVVGTPLYMSPEQASGQLNKIDEKTDVYGLGAILFSILTGKAPHEKSAATGGPDVDSVLKKIAEAETPSACDYQKCVPSELEAICTKAMARKQHLRFDSVQDLAEAVESWVAGQRGKQAAYDSLRMEGRELRADMQSRVRDLERNVRFASGLPPIEALISAESEEDIAIWRERLATIFQGLLKANPDYQSIVYCNMKDGKFSELVCVERHSNDATSIRVVPKSRLRAGSANDYISAVIGKKPDEVHTSLVCDPMCDLSKDCDEMVGLLSGVPVYDDLTEDVFGYVMINCNIDQMLRQQLSRRTASAEIVVACDIFHIMMHTKSGQVSEETLTKKVADETPYFSPAVEALQSTTDFIDETDNNVYGARLWFIPNQHGLMYLLRRKA